MIIIQLLPNPENQQDYSATLCCTAKSLFKIAYIFQLSNQPFTVTTIDRGNRSEPEDFGYNRENFTQWKF